MPSFNLSKAILLLFVLTILACKSDQSDGVEEFVPILTDDFKEFYDRFHTDTAFQLERITFPLAGMDDDVEGYQVKWSRDDWKFHKPYNDYNGTYQRSFESMGSIVAENIVSTNGQVSMMRRFAKVGGEWHLIYYKKMGAYAIGEQG